MESRSGRVDAVLFDLDGTLLDTLDDLASSANAMLATFDAPTHSSDAYRLLVGGGIQSLVRRALPEGLRDPQTVLEGVTRMRGFYEEGWRDQTRPYPGVELLLHALAERGVPMAILSNKPDDFTQRIAAALLPGHRFAQVRGALPDVPRKPDPTAAFEMAAALGIAPARCAYVGDSGSDVETARRAGMLAVAVLWGFRDEAELRGAGAEVVLTDPAELLDLV